MKTEEKVDELAKHLERQLLNLHQSQLLTGEALRQSLGYRSVEAFRQAISRQTVPVRVFSIENRRGKFALVKDIALWLATQRLKHESKIDSGET